MQAGDCIIPPIVGSNYIVLWHDSVQRLDALQWSSHITLEICGVRSATPLTMDRLCNAQYEWSSWIWIDYRTVPISRWRDYDSRTDGHLNWESQMIQLSMIILIYLERFRDPKQALECKYEHFWKNSSGRAFYDLSIFFCSIDGGKCIRTTRCDCDLCRCVARNGAVVWGQLLLLA
jgi:hypothetical protein